MEHSNKLPMNQRVVDLTGWIPSTNPESRSLVVAAWLRCNPPVNELILSQA